MPCKVTYVLRHNFKLFRGQRHFTYEKSHRILCKHTLRCKIIVELKEFEIMEKFYSSKTLLKLVGGGMHPPNPPSWICHWKRFKIMEKFSSLKTWLIMAGRGDASPTPWIRYCSLLCLPTLEICKSALYPSEVLQQN